MHGYIASAALCRIVNWALLYLAVDHTSDHANSLRGIKPSKKSVDSHPVIKHNTVQLSSYTFFIYFAG